MARRAGLRSPCMHHAWGASRRTWIPALRRIDVSGARSPRHEGQVKRPPRNSRNRSAAPLPRSSDQPASSEPEHPARGPRAGVRRTWRLPDHVERRVPVPALDAVDGEVGAVDRENRSQTAPLRHGAERGGGRDNARGLKERFAGFRPHRGAPIEKSVQASMRSSALPSASKQAAERVPPKPAPPSSVAT